MGGPDIAGVVLLFAVLVGGYLAFGVGAVVDALRVRVRESPAGALAGPGVLWLAAVLYAALSGLAVPPRAVAFVVFGPAHLPDPRYVLLAALAGLAYGWVYQRTARVTASAVTHALVDAVWADLLRAGGTA